VAPTWATYSDDNYGFAFNYPSDLTIETQAAPFQVLIFTEPEAPFYFRATRDYLPNEIVYFLDTAATGQRKIGEYTWTTYYLPNGYGDAVGFTPPLYALRTEVGNVLYSALFFNQDSTSELQDQILSTFRVLE
jgi:transglutaminase-like putative cysteine protease